ncbi:MAG: sigma-54-dependent transcriptional regulator [Bdellovibrionales bacterium]
MKHRLLIIDDDECAIEGIRLYLESNGFVVDFADNGDLGVALVRQNPGRYSTAIVDFFMPPGAMSGPEIIREIRRVNSAILILGLSGDNSVATHNASLLAGAESFFVKGDDLAKLYGIVRRLCDRYEEAHRVLEMASSRDEKVDQIESVGFIGCSTHLAQAAGLIKKFAKTDQTVLIRGENGTGKEKAARAIHMHSKRAGKRFVAVNVSALTESLFESELFGHEKGAFTGANRHRAGKFQQANGGTLFLDEIGDLPLDMQVKLLRALQEREVTPVGSERTVKVDVRIVAATNVDLETAVKSGRFREDLYYRIAGFPVWLKPLRERKDDIAPLVLHFTANYNRKNGTNKSILAKTVDLLCTYDWPGNIRELEHEVEKLLTLCDGQRVTPKDLDQKFHLSSQGEALIEDYHDLAADLKERERRFLARKLTEGNSIREVAAKMRMSKTTLLRRLKALGIEYKKETVTAYGEIKYT